MQALSAPGGRIPGVRWNVGNDGDPERDSCLAFIAVPVAATAADEDGDTDAAANADHVLWVPPTDPLLSPVVGVVPLQQLAYRLAKLHNHDVDRPRNLAKTVTVE